jgi:hypothetical protein
VPVIVGEPAAPGVYVTEQVVGDELPLGAQVVLLKVPPAPPSLNVTVPVGALLVPDEVSVTVAVQEVFPPYVSGFGVQLMPVEVFLFPAGGFVTVIFESPLLGSTFACGLTMLPSLTTL